LKRKEPLDLDQLSDHDIIKSFYFSQGMLLIFGCAGYLIFRNALPAIPEMFTFSFTYVLVLGMGSGVILALVELAIDRLVPEAWFDDGGINRRIFKAFSSMHIILAMWVVAVIEEFLFRGILQNKFGLLIASLIFGFVHFRYIKKPLMMAVALGLGFYLGWLYLYTQSLLPPIAAHFFIDVILGFVLKHRTERVR